MGWEMEIDGIKLPIPTNDGVVWLEGQYHIAVSFEIDDVFDSWFVDEVTVYGLAHDDINGKRIQRYVGPDPIASKFCFCRLVEKAIEKSKGYLAIVEDAAAEYLSEIRRAA